MANNYIHPPVFNSKTKSYRLWKEEVKAWLDYKDIVEPIANDATVSDRGLILALSLPKDDVSGIRDKVFNTVTRNEMRSLAGVQTIIDFLDSIFAQDPLIEAYTAYAIFNGYKRPKSQSIDMYVSEFERLYELTLKSSEDMVLPDSILAFKLLMNADLDFEKCQLVLTGVDYKKPKLYQQMVSCMKKLFSKQCIEEMSASTHAIKVEVEEQMETFKGQYEAEGYLQGQMSTETEPPLRKDFGEVNDKEVYCGNQFNGQFHGRRQNVPTSDNLNHRINNAFRREQFCHGPNEESAIGLNRSRLQCYDHLKVLLKAEQHDKGRLNGEQQAELVRLIGEHGHDWKKIGAMMNRSAASVKNHARKMNEKPRQQNKGSWTREEDEDLLDAVRAVTGVDDLRHLSTEQRNSMSWADVAERMTTRSRDQCWHRWHATLYHNVMGVTVRSLSLEESKELIDILFRMDINNANEIDWDAVQANFDEALPVYQLRERFKSLKRRVPDYQNKSWRELTAELKLVRLGVSKTGRKRRHRNVEAFDVD